MLSARTTLASVGTVSEWAAHSVSSLQDQRCLTSAQGLACIMLSLAQPAIVISRSLVMTLVSMLLSHPHAVQAVPCRGKSVALDCARGLNYLHSNKLIHFDLVSAVPPALGQFYSVGTVPRGSLRPAFSALQKSSNVLLTENGNAKIGE